MHDPVAAHNFLVDILQTFAETPAHYHPWCHVHSYRWHDPELEGGTATPSATSGERTAYAVIHPARRYDETRFRRPRPLDVALVAKGVELFHAPVRGYNEQARRRISAKCTTLNSDLDADDVDAIIQVAIYGEVLFS